MDPVPPARRAETHVTSELTEAVPAPWTSVDPTGREIRLVVCDMDGTLLLPGGGLPEGFAELSATMRERGITFVPASGRQLATLERMFPDAAAAIADNGALVVHAGTVVGTTGVGEDVKRQVVELVRASENPALGVVACGVRSAYVESDDPVFRGEVDKYYARLERVPDLLAVEDEYLKIAVFDAVDSQTTADTVLRPVAEHHELVVSGKHWVDVMNPAANKGAGLRTLQRALGVTAAQTVVFGDYLNDLEMLDEAELSFAVANAHPGVAARARYLAPSNIDGGVVQVLRHLLG